MPVQHPQQAYLHGHGLPRRWARRGQFVVLETAFGLGHHFLAVWEAWRQDPARCERLFYVAVEPRPVSIEVLMHAHELGTQGGTQVSAQVNAQVGNAQALWQAWPPLTPNFHCLKFEEGRVQLLLAFGEVAALLPKLRLQADAFCIEGLGSAAAPGPHDARIAKGLGALAAPGATLVGIDIDSARRQHLITAGFVLRPSAGAQAHPDVTLAGWAPRHIPRRPPDVSLPGRQAVVVGAGLAGAAAAQALVQAGWQVTVLERHAGPAEEASGNAAGLFHGTVNADDGPYARLFRAAALHAQRVYRTAMAQGVAGEARGLLRLDARAGGLQAMAQRCALPADYVEALSAADASAAAGLVLPAPAWLYPGGGWLAPAAWVRHALTMPGVTLVTGADVRSMTREGEHWVLQGTTGQELARAVTVVLAHAASAQRLLYRMGHAPWPLRQTRGQVTQFDLAHGLQLPVAGDGYAIPLPGAVLCGATRHTAAINESDEPEARTLRTADHQHNLDRLHRLTGLKAPADPSLWQGRTGWRLHSDDRLPIAGAVPLKRMPLGQRTDQARLIPRERGLFVLTALGARGITLAPLLAQLLAAQATGTPWPLEQELADAVDPGRWLVRATRRSGRGQPDLADV